MRCLPIMKTRQNTFLIKIQLSEVKKIIFCLRVSLLRWKAVQLVFARPATAAPHMAIKRFFYFFFVAPCNVGNRHANRYRHVHDDDDDVI